MTQCLGPPDFIGYDRVSSADQQPALQLDALNRPGCPKLLSDKASGHLDRLSELEWMLVQWRTGDSVVVWRLVRLGRSLRHLVALVEDLEERGVGFRSLTQDIDTTTAGGKLGFYIFGAMADFERSIIRERTKAGLAAARARGRKGGRPTVMTPEKIKIARDLYDSKQFTVETIAKELDVSRKMVYRHLNPARLSIK